MASQRRLQSLVLSPKFFSSRLATHSLARRQPHLTTRLSSTTATVSPPPPQPPRRSLPRRAISFAGRNLVLILLGFALGAIPAYPTIRAMLQPPTDAETLTMFSVTDDDTAAIEAALQSHPVTAALRAEGGAAAAAGALTESRPHLKIPVGLRPRNLTAGTLAGPGRVTVPPLGFADGAGQRYAQVMHLGTDLCGHPGIVHGGLLATLLDEALARCCFDALPHRVGVTASLKVDYRNPARAGQFVVVRATTTKVEGRKAWVRGRIETAPADPAEEPLVLAEAEGLFVSPKGAGVMAKLYPVT